ncbi:MAG: alanine racemase [Limnochordia bacterium]
MEGVNWYRPTWVEVSTRAMAENAKTLVALGKRKGLDLMAVVKADGYGHGALAAARAALAGGVKALAVALPEEGAALREGGIEAPILVMGAYVPGTAEVYRRYRLTATVSGFQQLRAVAREAAAGPVQVQLKVDTGMGRLGVLPEQALALAQEARAAGGVEVTGIYSHLATADDDLQFARAQMEAFDAIIDALDRRGLLPPQRHILNSAGLIRLDGGRTTMARVGIALYGLYPAPCLKRELRLVPALTWKTRVASVKRVPAGMTVSYGRTYRTASETTLATIPVGYADGFRRGLSGRVSVLIGGRRYPVVGAICMDQAVVDVGDAPVAEGDEVVLIGEQDEERIEADEWAERLGTINYEIVCGISARVPRLYVE